MKGVELKKEISRKKLSMRLSIAIILLLLLIAVYFGYYFFLKTKSCENLDCFRNSLKNCKRASYIKEDSLGVWYYDIKGGAKDSCNIKVKLLKLKQGKIDMEHLQNKEMTCNVINSENFPEEDISRCSGVLKEELQELIIQRMHNYLLQNLGEIKEEFKGI